MIALLVLIVHIHLDALGRKYSIMMAAFVFTIGGIFQIIGNNLEMLYVGRVISGLGMYALIARSINNLLHHVNFHYVTNKVWVH